VLLKQWEIRDDLPDPFSLADQRDADVSEVLGDNLRYRFPECIVVSGLLALLGEIDDIARRCKPFAADRCQFVTTRAQHGNTDWDQPRMSEPGGIDQRLADESRMPLPHRQRDNGRRVPGFSSRKRTVDDDDAAFGLRVIWRKMVWHVSRSLVRDEDPSVEDASEDVLNGIAEKRTGTRGHAPALEVPAFGSGARGVQSRSGEPCNLLVHDIFEGFACRELDRL